VPSPKRSASPRATSTLQWRIGLKALDPERPIREADINSVFCDVRFVPKADIRGLLVSRDNQQNNTTDYGGNRGN
jgi:hypothetical protein